MEIKHPQWFGLLASEASIRVHADAVVHKRTKRNLWVVVGFFGLVIVAWINSQM